MQKKTHRILEQLEAVSLDAATKLFYRKYGGMVSTFRRDPTIQARLLHGIVVPPHERAMFRPARWHNFDEYHFVGGRGVAKSVAWGTIVIMADGTRQVVENIKVGDTVMGPDGLPRTVLDVRHGEAELYKVSQRSGGIDYVVNGDHILSLRLSDYRKDLEKLRITYPVDFIEMKGSVIDISVRDYLNQGPHFKNIYHGYKAYSLPFKEKPVDIDPYFLGIWLGDGTGCYPEITTADQEIIEYIKNIVDSAGGTLNIRPPCGEARKMSFVFPDRPDNPLFAKFREYGVASATGNKSINKHIPLEYIKNSEEIRLELLAGLIDSDGYLDTHSNGYTIVQGNETLARDIRFLADTLGFKTSFKEVKTYFGKKRGTAFKVHISGDAWRIPCKLPRKILAKEDVTPNKDYRSRGIDITPVGVGKYAGIYLDGDHKFLLEDCTVTHNSFVVASMIPTLEAEVFGRKKLSSLSASKFRGGKVIIEEATKLIFNGLDAQHESAPFAREMLTHKAGVKKEADRWYIRFKNDSEVITIPTGNEETARGLRAHKLFLDEADNWSKNSVDKIFGPFLAVKSNFAAPGRTGSANKIFFTGTVSYTHKDWARALQDRENILRKKYYAYKYFDKGEFETWQKLLNEDNQRIKYASFLLQRWDYTDLIIPEVLNEHYVHYPTINGITGKVDINSEDFLQFDNKENCSYIYTYPVDKNQAEKGLEDGLTDFDTWAAEWRCQFVETSGNVYPFDLIEKATNVEVLDVSDLKTLGWDSEELGPHYPQLLYECSDPCILGVDPARTSDFAAFVVIRIGELAKGNYNPLTGTGHTSWNNIIWAEQKRHMTIHEVAEKIIQLKKRYNLYVPDNPELAPGITIDARGAMAGTTVRDELAKPSQSVDEQGNLDPTWIAPTPIYDPTDKEYVVLKMNQKAWPGLRLLWTSDTINTELVSFSKGQLEVSKLYIAKSLTKTERAESRGELDAGYMGVKVLIDQLVSIQGIPTKYAYRYEMPGNSRRVEMKKDMFSAFLYACSALRDHRKLLIKQDKRPPAMAAYAVRPRGAHRVNLYRDVFQGVK